jgi:cellulose synthase/poly-beta-1,6-N-acetylglucosamine synthase-like glycosyltransferase
MVYDVVVISSQLSSYFQDYASVFASWLHSLTTLDILLILAFGLVNISKSMIKTAVLAIHSLKQKFVKNQLTSSITQPKITILIPAHNESASIVNTIRSVIENSYHNKEIIVIDDNSTDNTYNSVCPFQKKGLIKIIRRQKDKGSRAEAINCGIRHASGDIILTMDGDTLLDRVALMEVAKHFSNPEVTAVAGNVRVIGGDGGINNILTKCQAYEFTIGFELERRVRNMLNILIAMPGAFTAFRKELFTKSGLFETDTTITEDLELTFKLFATGGKIMFAPNAVVWTCCPPTWKAWLRQRLRWNYGTIVTLIKHVGADSAKNDAWKRLFVLAWFDMLFIDVFSIGLKVTAITYIVLNGIGQSPQYVITFIIVLLFLNEFFKIGITYLFSARKDVVKYAPLIPFTVLIYRPLCFFARLYAYFAVVVKAEVKW